jgi:alanyl-tRNA synthetase
LTTERLYHQDAYLQTFDAEVTACEPGEGGWWVTLERTCFYATCGGQGADTGELDGQRVLDVAAQGEAVRHLVAAPIPVGRRVRGRIDWARRFDHMQQHAGQHLISYAIWRQLDGYSLGLHIGHEDSYVDVELPEGAPEPDLAALEDMANELVWRDLPIRCYFPTPEEYASMHKRKRAVIDTDQIRMVDMGGVEVTPCGGTHPSSTGQIGLIKITSLLKTRGMHRFFFLCGARAFADYRRRFEQGNRAAALLSTQVEQLPGAVDKLLAQRRELSAQARAQQRRLGELAGERLAQAGSPEPWGMLYAATLPDALDMACLREMANRLLSTPGAVALLQAPQEGGGYGAVFARAEGLDLPIHELFTRAVRAAGGQGGGKPAFAQGKAPQPLDLGAAADSVRARLRPSDEK